METSGNEDKKECKTEGGCSGCCCAKLAIAVVLLLLGGVVGYLAGRCSMGGCGQGKWMGRPGMGQPCPMTGPAVPAEKAK